MKLHPLTLAPALVAVASLSMAATTTAPRTTPKSSVTNAFKPSSPAAASIHFEPNMGQTNPQVRYMGRGRGSTIFITDKGAVLTSMHIPALEDLKGNLGSYDPTKFVFDVQALHMDLAGSRMPTAMNAAQPQESFSSYYKGNDRSKWISKVPQFGRVEAKRVYPGVDIVYYGTEGQLE
jgi:hypothetical protein